MNDARGPRNNVRYLPLGRALGPRPRPPRRPRRRPPKRPRPRRPRPRRGAELLVNYGQSFWRLHQT
eukprot:6641377-Prymnesium_polylepis.1